MSFSPLHPDNPDSLKILVVDDEEQVRVVLEALLVLAGHRVGLASDGLTAFAKFQADLWDIVLTDRQMPMVDGEALARLLKARSPRTPVIMITGCPPPGGCADVDAIVHKPFTLATLKDAIDACWEKRELWPHTSGPRSRSASGELGGQHGCGMDAPRVDAGAERGEPGSSRRITAGTHAGTRAA